jgi:adenine nucleotide transporter 17
MGRDGTTTIGSKQGEGRQYTGMFDCLRNVSNDEGICALWQGTFTSIILALNPAIQLGVYEALKRHRLIFGGSLGPFVNSFLAKLIATVVTYPIQVLQTRRRAGIQKDKMTASRLFRGLEAKLLQTCLNSGIMFVAYERLVGLLTIMTTSNDKATFRGV